MKYLFFFAIPALLFAFNSVAQRSEELVPQEAISVLSINNVNLLQKISLDELVQYRFMEELHHDIMDGSTAGWTLKDSGIDFDQKLNVFLGGTGDYEVSGLSFGVKEQERLFKVFDDFEPIESELEGLSVYASYFNRLVIKGDDAILFRISPDYYKVSEITDSIWYARGNGYRWEEFETYEEFDEEEASEWDADSEGEGIIGKTYYELLDSVEAEMHEMYLHIFTQNLFVEGNNLMQSNPDFATTLEANAEGSYFVNNTANFRTSREFKTMKERSPKAYARMEELYDGNMLSGNFSIEDQRIQLNLEAQYGGELGAIYEQLGTAKFQKDLLPYINENDIAFTTIHADIEDATDLMHETLMSVLTQSDREEFVGMSISLDLLHAFIDTEALFEAFKGGVFMSFKGIQKVKTRKIVFDYNEETFDYIEREEEAEEDMPVFAWGFATGNHKLIERIIQHSQRAMNRRDYEGAQHLIDHENYWEITNGILGSVSMYIINKNGVFIVTNDLDLVQNNSDGYANEAISKKRIKKARKGGTIYAYADMNRAIDELPRELFSDQENEMLDVFRGKSGTIELTSTKSSGIASNYALTYTFDTEADSGTYILDLINSLYVISK